MWVLPKSSREISRLPDGRLFFLGDDGTWAVFENGAWGKPDGIPLSAVSDSKPLLESELNDLVAAGLTLPQ